MSAQPSDQIGGSPPMSALFQRRQGAFGLMRKSLFPATNPSILPSTPVTTDDFVTPPTPATPPPVPLTDPTPPPVPDTPPQVAEPEEVAQQEEAEEKTEPAPVELEQVAETFNEEVQEEVAQDELPPPLETVSEVETVMDTLNPPDPMGGGTAKEAPFINVTVENPIVDVAGGVQYVEAEKTPEMPPEVEGFLKKVEDNVDQIPQEIVLTNMQSGVQLPRVLAQPVVVLPITVKLEDEGKRKSEDFSIRWLIEWSWKMMKTFSGKVIYREDDSGADAA